MASLDDVKTAGTDGATGAAGSTNGATSASDTGAGGTDTSNSAAAMGTEDDAGVALKTGADGATGTSTATAAMVATTTASTALTKGTSSHKDKTNKTQETITLPSPTDKLAKELKNTPIDEQRRLAAQLQSSLPQDSPHLTQLNDDKNKPAVGIINIPKSSTIRFLHSFGVGTNPIGVSSPISGNILSLAGNGSSDNPP